MKKHVKWIWITISIIAIAITVILFVNQHPNKATVTPTSSLEVQVKPSASISPSVDADSESEPAVTPTDTANSESATGSDAPKSVIDEFPYETLDVERNGNHVTAYVVLDASSDDVTRFSTPYINFIKQLNEGVNDVVIKVYRTNSDFQAKKAAWEVANGVLHSL